MNYVVKAVQIENRELVKVKASKTSTDFSMFFPPDEFTRKELIVRIRQGDVFYKWYRDGKKVPIQLKFTINLGIDQFDDVTRY